MNKCPNCTLEQEHEIYTCMNCGHVVKSPPTKKEAQEIIRLAAAEGRVVFETEGTTHLCVCTKCGWWYYFTFFRREVNVSEDAGPCGDCGEWAMTLKEDPDA